MRAGCVRCLARMKAATPAVVATVQALKADADPRVQHEADCALTVLAPGQTAPADATVLPAGAKVTR